MKKLIAFLFILGNVFAAKADHITGGEMYYTFNGVSNGIYNYSVTLKLFMRCNSGRSFNDPTQVSVFNKKTGARMYDLSVPLAGQTTLDYTNTNPCITDPPVVCYVVGLFNFNVSVPASADGYVIASQVNYRVAGISNLNAGYGLIGATYTAEIPGTTDIQEAPKNNSARFSGDDLVIVCENNSFVYNFSATDADGDQLRYSFCNAYTGGPGGAPGSSTPPSAPPYSSLPYGNPNFSAGAPLGAQVQINANTGVITGIAPAEGKYVVTVCVEELRNGKVIATQRKDLQINIASCSIAAATLYPSYSICKNSKSISISNLSLSPLINTHTWQFFNAAGVMIFTTNNADVNYTFPDTGTYTIKLYINQGQPCSDSARTVARVYPGLVPDFNFAGICFNKPTQFTDASTSVYGTINSWAWDFGETNAAVSNNKNPSYTYLNMGAKNIRLIVGDSKGCSDTIIKPVSILDKPPLSLAFRDSLICVPDKVQLIASGQGNFSWTPHLNIANANTANPVVNPAITTTYFVVLEEEGCVNQDSVKIRVVDHVSLKPMADTIVCTSDLVQLHVLSDGLQFAWTPGNGLNDPNIPNPSFVSLGSGTYTVTATIGSCQTSAPISVKSVPYPTADAGSDTTICFQTNAQLHAKTDGVIYKWTPAASLNNANIPDPIASPLHSTAYVFFAYDNKGCPKPGTDTVFVTMLPNMHAFAGNDTAVVVNQPLQLHANGGVTYVWSPATGLSATNIANPIGVYTEPNPGILYKVLMYNEANCADSAFVRVKVFKTRPSIFVPNAFTPNADGKNDFLRPIAVGILKMEYFNIYNRWGQLVFSTNVLGMRGWNGMIAGKLAESGTYVWIVKATDYTGAAYFEKGSTVLLR